MPRKQATNWTLKGEAIDEGLHMASDIEEWVSEPTVLGKHKHKTASRKKRAFRKQSGVDLIEAGATYICNEDKGELSVVTVLAKNDQYITVKPLSNVSSLVNVADRKIGVRTFLAAYSLHDDVEGLMSL